jgi:RNA-directed DNA polymerase
MNVYTDVICNFENLREAYRLAHRSKSECPEVIEFDRDILGNLLILKRQLINKEWDKIFEYYRFEITVPKKRIVDALTFRGRIVQHVLCDNILKPWFEKRLVKENCACREDKGTQYAANLVKQGMVKFLKNHDDGYCLKMDVKSYFPSIDRKTLKEMLKDFPYEDIKEFLFWIIDHCPESNGLPIGNQTSQWMALYYLNKIDRIIKEKYRIKYYARYMDDLIIIHEDKKYLEKLLSELTIFANDKLKLTFNDKTQIFPLHKGISFLG